MPLKFVDNMLAFFKKAISCVFKGDWLFCGECSPSGTQSRSKSFLNLNPAILLLTICKQFIYLVGGGDGEITLISRVINTLQWYTLGDFWD